jgi:hypothetical protein
MTSDLIDFTDGDDHFVTNSLDSPLLIFDDSDDMEGGSVCQDQPRNPPSQPPLLAAE